METNSMPNEIDPDLLLILSLYAARDKAQAELSSAESDLRVALGAIQRKAGL